MRIKLADDTELSLMGSLYPYTVPFLCHDEKGYTLIAEKDDGRPAGFASVFRRAIPAPLDGAREDFINVIEVFEEADRRQGIASRLVQEILRLARENGSLQVRAYCDIGNTASHRLWLKNGFGISPAAQSDGQIPGSFVTCRL